LRRARVAVTEVTTADHVAQLAAQLDGAALLIDAVFGTGLNADVEGHHADVLHLMNASGIPILAGGIPARRHADHGTPLGVAIQAEATATFGFAKIGQVIHPGIENVGALAVVDIGIAPAAVAEVNPRTRLLEPNDVAALVPVRAAEAHKGTCGHVLI